VHERLRGIIGRMTDRGRTSMEGTSACPFIAYEDERDERSAEPDHAHRCYAEVRPAPRALAHQEAYCLSSAFPVCPTFQAWARREAAQARSAAAAASATAAGGVAVPSPEPSREAPSAPHPEADGIVDPDLEAGDDPSAQRNPPRDWAAPPPWATGAAGASSARAASRGDAPDFLASRSSEGQGLAGSAADRLAGGASIADVTGPPVAIPSSAPSAPADPDLADLVGGPTWRAGSTTEPPEPLPPPRSGKRPPVSSTRDRNVDRTPVQEGPSWERARRYEAYPTIKTRTGMPGIPRVLLLAGALGIAALALFFLPALLGVGGKDKGGTGPSPSASLAAETASPSPTVQAAPTAQVYVVKSGDTFTRIAKKNNVTVEQLKAANPGIKDINKIAPGDEIVIPVPPPDVITEPSVAPSASP
jgi:LysM repeat protein